MKNSTTENSIHYIDTHCHIDSICKKMGIESYAELKPEFPKSYEGSIHVSCDPDGLDYGISIIKKFPELYAALGIHPHDAKEYSDLIHQKIVGAMELPHVVAWGEIGLDYHYDFSPREIQIEVFARQLSEAVTLKKPVILHSREADDDTLALLRKYLPKEINTHIHCFTGSIDFAKELLGLYPALFFGFTGVITFKNSSDLCNVVKWLPLENILLETDAPYMAPVPHRGKTAHQGMIPHIAEKIAEIKDIPLCDVYQQCRKNTTRMYGV